MSKASKSLGTLLVIIGTILFLIVCGQFIWRMILAIGCLYIIGYGLQLRGSKPLFTTVGIWTGKMWD
jgi:hypothetical protein